MKKQRKMIIFSMIGIVCFFSLGYATFSQNFLVSGKGTIVEKPITIDELREKKCNVVKDDGLYIDTYEDGRCIYKGANPDNFILFNNELWRILAVENDNTLKIMKNNSIGNMAWDESNSNMWTRPATLNTYLNNDYYNSIDTIYKNIINKHDFPIGPVTWNNDNLAEQITSEKGVLWNGNVALISSSDYLKANSNEKECGNFKLQYNNYEICPLTNYIFSMTKNSQNNPVWAINPRATDRGSYPHYVVFIGSNASSTGNNVDKTDMGGIPVVYLNSDIKLRGHGTEKYPYEIAF